MSDLSGWRERIDELDRELVRLLNERAECVLNLAPLKRAQKMDVLDKNREERVRANIRAANGGPLSDDALVEVIERVMATMRDIQKP